jgi:hypothetical protein
MKKIQDTVDALAKEVKSDAPWVAAFKNVGVDVLGSVISSSLAAVTGGQIG